MAVSQGEKTSCHISVQRPLFQSETISEGRATMHVNRGLSPAAIRAPWSTPLLEVAADHQLSPNMVCLYYISWCLYHTGVCLVRRHE